MLIYAAPAYGLRLAVAAIVGLIMVVGGRITPSFTSNWSTRQRSEMRPAPLGRFDIGSIALAALALVAWVVAPDWYGAAALLLLMAIARAARLSRWVDLRTWREPILFILHVGYAFVPLGALMLSISIFWPEMVPASGALHAWTTILIYGAILVASFARIAAPLFPTIYYQALLVAGVGWLLAFGIFLLIYGPMLLGAKRTS